jgi:serine/threonine-protein kinase
MAVQTIRLAAIGDMGLRTVVGTGAAGPGSAGAAGAAPSGSASLDGRRLGGYRVGEPVGAGAHATVHRARHELMGVERAIKVLRPSAAGCPEQREQFMREARIAATIRHPNLVSVFDCGVDPDGTAYIVMEYVAGRTLASRLRDGVPPAAESMRIARQVADALDHAHRHGVVHRDVKPANILLGDDGTARLGDFGIAHLEHEPASRRGGPLVALGTPAYMSPEQCAGQHGRADACSDRYSLAVVLYEMLTGRTPYGQGRAALSGHTGEAPPPPPRTVNPYLPEAVDRVLGRGLDRDPRRRHAGAGELVAELADALAEGRESAPADAPTALSPIVRQSSPPKTGAAGPPPSSRWLARWRSSRRRP